MCFARTRNDSDLFREDLRLKDIVEKNDDPASTAFDDCLFQEKILFLLLDFQNLVVSLWVFDMLEVNVI